MNLEDIQAKIHELLANDMLERLTTADAENPLSAAEWTSIMKYLHQAGINLNPSAINNGTADADDPLAALVKASQKHVAELHTGVL